MNDIVDMSRFIEAKSDQINADDLIGTSKTITITRVTGNDGDQPVSIYYQGDNGKPFKPCKTIRRVLMGVWGKYANEYVGKSMTIYRDDAVTFGGLATGGIRISHMSHIDKETVVVVMKSKGKKAGVNILPLRMDGQGDTFTIDHAGADLRDAGTLDELKAIWSRKIMAPHRTALQPVLDEMKQALAEPEQGRADSEMGEQNSATSPADAKAAEILAAIEDADDIDDLGAVMAGNRSHMAALDEDATTALWQAHARRKAALIGSAK